LLYSGWDSYLAEVAEVEVSKSGEVRVHRVVCAVDCGHVVNPAIIAQQIRSGIVFGLMEGQGRAERILRWLARHLRLSEDRAAAGVRHVGLRLEDLAGDRKLLGRVLGWAGANWILDAAANPIVLRGSYNGKPFLEVVKLSFPTGHSTEAARIERQLAKEGRAAVRRPLRPDAATR